MQTDKAPRLRLLEIASAYIDRHVVINESISRSRTVGGHDRHFATQSQFSMIVKHIHTFVSGAQLQLDSGDNTWYGIALDTVVRVDDNTPGRLEILEHFEMDVERKTIIRWAEADE